MWIDTLDVFIGLVSVFLILSLIVSALGEGVSTLTNLKGEVLSRLIERLLGEEEAAAFFNHSEIRRLQVRDTRKPSYVPDILFAEVLLDLLVNPARADERQPLRKPVTASTVDHAMRHLPGSGATYADALLDLWQRAEADVDTFRVLITRWFNRTGDRSIGWFRRRLGLYLFGLGLVCAVALNADTIYMFKTLSSDASLRAQFVENAVELVADMRDTGLDCSDDRCIELVTDFVRSRTAEGLEEAEQKQLAGLCGQSTLDPDSCASQLAGRLDQQRRLCRAVGNSDDCNMRELLGAALPQVTALLGPDLLVDQLRTGASNPAFWLLKLLGWLLTAAAISLGAPFWFDLLQRFVQIRKSLKPETLVAPEAASQSGVGEVADVPAARSVARAVAAADQACEDLAHFEHKTFGYSPLNLFWSARLSKLAYVTEADLIAAELESWGAKGTLVTGAETQCVVATTPTFALVSFRGTEKKLADWLTNIAIDLTAPTWDPDAGFRVHKGFDEALDAVWTEVESTFAENDVFERKLPIWLSGHSLGGAVATLAALRLAHMLEQNAKENMIGAVHTFGQPRVGDRACADALERLLPARYFRSINQRDIVSRVPLPKTPDIEAKLRDMKGALPLHQYAHAGRVLYFTDSGRAMMDPPLWYRKLDTLAVGLTKDEIKAALSETVGDHDIGAYVRLHRALVAVLEA